MGGGGGAGGGGGVGTLGDDMHIASLSLRYFRFEFYTGIEESE